MRRQSSAQKAQHRLWSGSTLWNLPWFLSVRKMKGIILEERTSEQILTGFPEKREPDKSPQLWERIRSALRLRPCSASSGGRTGAANEAPAALKPLSVTVIPRSCRSTGVLHNSGSASADYPQYTKGVSWPQRVFCWLLRSE